VLRALGLADELAARSSPVRRIDGRTMAGRRVMDFGYGDVDARVTGWGVHRATLFDLLWSALERSGIPVRAGTPVARLAAEAGGWRRIALVHPGGAPRLTIAMDRVYRYAQVFTGDTLPPHLRRRGLAVEPMSCAANAFNSGDGLLILQPGETWSGVWEARVTG
jgi:hypothetical protein